MSIKIGILEDLPFSTIIRKGRKAKICLQSYAISFKPLITFLSLFGFKLLKYTKNGIVPIKIWHKLYSLLIILALNVLIIKLNPGSWRETMSDSPLNILTKTYGILNIFEVLYSVFAAAFVGSSKYVCLFKKLDSIDNHMGITTAYKKRRVVSVVLVILPLGLLSMTFWLRKFYIQNIGAHLTFFLIMLQGTLLGFFIVIIYIKLKMLNRLLLEKSSTTLTTGKVFWFNLVYEVTEKEIHNKNNENCPRKYCWLELMQIYDKLADSIALFNKIYSSQVFLMYNSWVLCTLLIICRSLSPSIKNSDVYLSDLFLYLCINSRPVFLASMCELFNRERKKALNILINLLCYDMDGEYYGQVNTMMMLVKERNMEISAIVFSVDVPNVLTYAGRIISYTVLMIQYFYMHTFLK